MFQSPFDLIGEDTRNLLQLTNEDQLAMPPISNVSQLAGLKEPISSFTFDLPALPPVLTTASVTDGAATPQSIATPRTTPGAMAVQQQCNEVNLPNVGLLGGDASPRSHFGGFPSGMRTTTPSPCGSAPVDDNDLLSSASTQELELLLTLLQQTQALQNSPSASLDQHPASMLDLQSQQQLAALALQQNVNNINDISGGLPGSMGFPSSISGLPGSMGFPSSISGVPSSNGAGFSNLSGGLYNNVGMGVQNVSGLQMGGGFGSLSAPVSPTINALTAIPNFSLAATNQPVAEEKYKTEVCRLWEKDGWCKFGEGCHFAHGAHELNQAVKLWMMAFLVKAKKNGTES
eukprot:TRINITY_DN537_c0_g1_i5.p1 TRINITY_DN537_c0_g1~~TRINITY_DN537_c0_g1_i5.p1  ORF type:complete len:346 (-),score=78.40 TRINITY_DN537_c0_g1_i5:35-1072(-)